MEIPVETSARHVHLARPDLEKLFGEGYELTPERELSQPGQFLSKERLVLVGPKGKLERVAILGPLRDRTQVEVSLTDCFSLGVEAPIRESGDLDGSAGITLVGPKGEVALESGLIVAKRHIHASPEDAEKLDVKDGDRVMVRIPHTDRSLWFDEVLIRVRPDFHLALHLDTDEANAAGVRKGARAECWNN